MSILDKLLICIYPNKFGTKRHQNHQYLFNGVLILPSEMQHTHTLYDQRRLCNVSLNVIIIISNIEMKHHMKCDYVWTSNAVQFSCLPLSLTHVLTP